MHSVEPIAIIGVGCRLPGGVKNTEDFWKLLVDGVDAITEVPEDRWHASALAHPDPSRPGRTSTRRGGFLNGIDQFDAQFFGINAHEAAAADPQQRLLLEIAYEAVEDAGLTLARLAGQRAGVYIGISAFDYGSMHLNVTERALIDRYSNLGAAHSVAANRISYFFNLSGPSLAVDTACSSSLVATHLGCTSIWQRESDLAFVGGVNVIVRPETTIGFSKAAMLSPDGRCKSFDAAANGYVRGEGAAVLILKPMARAIAEGDTIYALIRASAVNQDGRTQGISVPSRAAQADNERAALRLADIAPQSIQYVEAHGTGTPVGDPIEASAIGAVYGLGRTADEQCVIGSVKSNVGHLEAASGVTGMLKAVLALRHRQVPATIHLANPNPAIPFDDLGLRVARQLESWPATNGQPARAGVNSFGFGGTNAHVVLEEAPDHPVSEALPVDDADAACILPLSARTAAALPALARRYLDALVAEDGLLHAPLGDICFSAATRRSHHPFRQAFVAPNKTELARQLEVFVAQETGAGNLSAVSGSNKPVFVCSGMGQQWWGMGRELLAAEPVFRRSVEEISQLFEPLTGWSLLDKLGADERTSQIQDTDVAQPAIFAVQVALAGLWRSWGITPAAVLGHSAGEMAAACIAGALSLEDGVAVTFHRSRLQRRTAGQGVMLAAGISPEEAERLVEGHPHAISIAAINSVQSVTLSGDSAVLAEVAQKLEALGRFNRVLQVEVPFHSPRMEPLERELVESLQSLRPRAATIPLFSTVAAARIAGPELDAAYWYRNVRQPVLFSDSIAEVIKAGHAVFLELGAHPVLRNDLAECLNSQSAQGTVLGSLRRGEPDRRSVLATLARLYALGCDIAWPNLFMDAARVVRLPTYPFQRESFWRESEYGRQQRVDKSVHPLLGNRTDHAQPCWKAELDRADLQYLSDHRIGESAIFPGAGFVEMGLALARQNLDLDRCDLEDVEFQKFLVLDPKGGVVTQVTLDSESGDFRVHAKGLGSDSAWDFHASGAIRHQGRSAPPALDLDAIRRSCSEPVDRDDYFKKLSAIGFNYGPTFRSLTHLWRGDSGVLGEVNAPADVAGAMTDYLWHPAVLDACLQMTLAFFSDDDFRKDELFVPARIGRVRCYGPATPRVFVYSRLQDFRRAELKWSFNVLDETGRVLLVIEDLVLAATRHRVPPGANATYELRWMPAALPAVRGQGDASPLLPPDVPQLEREREVLFRRFDRARYQDRFPALGRATVASYIAHALTELGGSPADFTKSAETLVHDLGIAPQYHQWMRLTRNTFTPDEILSAPAPSVSWNRLWDEFPDSHSELKLLRQCGENLAAVLKDAIDPLTLIFPEGSAGGPELLYRDSPTYRVGNLLAQKVMEQIVARLLPGRALRVLEVGGGVGGMTSHLLPVLPVHCIEYVFTDISASFLPQAAASFSHYPFVYYRVLDIERDPLAQGFDEHSFDLIVASDVLHATRNLGHTLDSLKRLLRSDGSLMMLELLQSWPASTMTVGLLKGWWLFDDPELRLDGPCASQTTWRSLLEQAGFGNLVFLPDTPDPGKAQHALILARGPRLRAEPAIAQRPRVDTKSWLIFVDRDASGTPGAGIALAAQLSRRGDRIIEVAHGTEFIADVSRFTIRAGSADDMKRLLATLAADTSRLAGAIHLWSLDAAPTETITGDSLVQSTDLGCVSVAQFVQALADFDALRIESLWLVTRRAQCVEDTADTVEIAQSPMCGFGRVLGSEYQNLRVGMIDIADGSTDEITALVEHVTSADSVEDEIALRGELKFVRRLVRASRADKGRPRRQRGAVRPPFRLEVQTPGILASMAAIRLERIAPKADEVEIEVAAAGINFKDIMLAMGMLPKEATGGISSEKALGLECAGQVIRIGTDVKEFAVGDEVVVGGVPAFATHITINKKLLSRKPADLTLEAAATLPVAFTTASYALHNLAQVGPGERVLIHAATGGVGLAAVQIAKAAGAVIFATAGSPEKRALLTALGVPHVMDSRNLDFADEIMDGTNGEGIDVVLNSLTGEAIDKSLSVLRPYGRFVEIGMVDIYKNRKLGLRALRKNIAYFTVDLSRPFEPRPLLARSVFNDVASSLTTRQLRPLPYSVFPVARAADAFRQMAQAKHVGKLLVSFKDTAGVVVERASEPLVLDPSASYLITGGLGGFGLAAATHLARRGARRIVLVGRNAPSPAALSAIDALRRSGVSITICQQDVADHTGVEKALAAARELGPLRGIMHAAMVLDDAPIERLSSDRLWKVMAPKALGAWYLHRATAGEGLDFFVLFSSVATIFGNPGQANYCAGNAFLESLADYRRMQGLPALAVNWGVVGDVGHVARNFDSLDRLRTVGYKAMSAADMLATMEEFLVSEATQVTIADVNWSALFGAGVLQQSARYAAFTNEASADKDRTVPGSRPQAILAANSELLPSLLEGYVRDYLARAMGMPATRIDPQQSLLDLGLDSLIAIEVRNQINADFGINVPLSIFTQSGSVNALARYVAERLLESRSETGTETVATTTRAAPNMRASDPDADIIAHVDQLSDEELDRELEVLVPNGVA